jgi:PRTRC genetic system protein E
MFQELMPLLAQRALCITVSRKAVDEICLNVIPKRLKEGENESLSTPLSVTGSPKELDEKLPTVLIEFVSAHLELSSNLRSASEQMKAAAQKAKDVKQSAKPCTAPAGETPSESNEPAGATGVSSASAATNSPTEPASGSLFGSSSTTER